MHSKGKKLLPGIKFSPKYVLLEEEQGQIEEPFGYSRDILQCPWNQEHLPHPGREQVEGGIGNVRIQYKGKSVRNITSLLSRSTFPDRKNTHRMSGYICI